MSIEAAGETSCSKIRVILVEDHVLTRMRLTAVLGKGPGIELVDHADNGQTAIELVEKHRPDLVLMDVGLPVMDGIEAATTIRKLYPEVKIVMLTAHDNDGDVFAALAAGAGGYCLKNMEPERLFRAIISVNDGDVWLDSGIASKVVKLYSPLSEQGQSVPGQSVPGQSVQGQSVQGQSVKRQSVKEESAKGDRRDAVYPASGALDGNDKTGDTTSLPELPNPLSSREMEVLNLLVSGLSNQQIADSLIISLATTKSHVRNILNKLAVDDRTQAAVQAMRRGLV